MNGWWNVAFAHETISFNKYLLNLIFIILSVLFLSIAIYCENYSY